MGKRNKGKQTPQTTTAPEPIMDDDGALMDDLLAQLDSQNVTVQAQSATILNEMNLNEQAAQIESSERQDPKSRFKARQVSTPLVPSITSALMIMCTG